MIAPIRFRAVTGRNVAFSIWLLADGTVRRQRETPAAYAAQSWQAPAVAARFCMAWMTPELNTTDGLPHSGDVWEQGGRVLVCTGEGFDYSFHSRILGVRFRSSGHLVGERASGDPITRADFLAWNEATLTFRNGRAPAGVAIAAGVLTVDDLRIKLPLVERIL